MDAFHLIAQMLSIVYITVGVGIVLNSNRYRQLFDAIVSDDVMLYFGGVFALLGGFLMITFGPNVWTASVEGLLTLIGWVALIKGIFLLIRPAVLQQVAGFWKKNTQLAAAVCVVLGLILGNYGFL